MKNKLKKYFAVLMAAAVLAASLSGCSSEAQVNSQTKYDGEKALVLSDSKITLDGKAVGANGEVYTSNDVIYYEDKDVYESGNPYGEGTDSDKHTAEEAASVTVVNITEAGIYRLSGKMSNGQIRVDLGEDAAEDETAVVTLVLDGLDIKCDVAPAVVFMNVYECDGDWCLETAQMNVDTSKAGANVIVADGSVNNIEGAYVAKIFKDKEGEKKLWKQDGAFYSYMSMNINGEEENSGVLNIVADNEGLCAELHLTINGGNINIYSQDDGINTNEDNVSVTTVNGGDVRIVAGMGPEYGDGIDSNGWIVVNGGTVVTTAHPHTDSGIDNENGCYVNGGTLISMGGTVDWVELDSQQTTLNLQFKEKFSRDTSFVVTDSSYNVVFCYDASKDEVVNSNVMECRGVIIASPQFKVGETYNLHIGGEVKGENKNGIYDVSTIEGFENAAMQVYYSSDSFGHGGFTPDTSKAYYADNNFVLNNTVSCFAEITG